MTRPVIGSHYDPSKRPKLDQDAELVQRALNPGHDTKEPIHMPRWSLDGVIFTAVAMVGVTLVAAFVASLIY